MDPNGPFGLPPLNALRVFEVAARLGSFKAAAEALYVTPSAVSHQVANLETFLGLPLFRRDGRGLRLTNGGEAYQRQVHEALARLARATRSFADVDRVPALIVGAAPSIAGKWLLPQLADFMAEHPDLSLRVEASPDRAGLADVDVSILHGDVRGRVTGAVPLIAERLSPLCSPKLLRDNPSLRRPEDLSGHVLIQTRNPIQWQAWLLARGLDFPIRREIWLDRSSMAIEAAAKGRGIILESDFLAAEEIASGMLVRPFEPDILTEAHTAYYLVLNADPDISRPALAFADWIKHRVPSAFRPTV